MVCGQNVWGGAHSTHDCACYFIALRCIAPIAGSHCVVCDRLVLTDLMEDHVNSWLHTHRTALAATAAAAGQAAPAAAAGAAAERVRDYLPARPAWLDEDVVRIMRLSTTKMRPDTDVDRLIPEVAPRCPIRPCGS